MIDKETKFRELDASQKIKVCARLFQNAETVLGIGRAMDESAKAARQEQIKALAKLLDLHCGWLKIKALAGLAENAALTAQVAHVSPALIINYIKDNEQKLREMCKDVVPALPEHIPKPKTDAERLAELENLVLNESHKFVREMYEAILSNVYYNVLERCGLLPPPSEISQMYRQELELNKVRFLADSADIRTKGMYERFINELSRNALSGMTIYEADALRRTKAKICENYIYKLKSVQNEKSS